MSAYKLNLRGVTRAAREYTCPEHGPFELEVDLATSGDPRPCPTCGAASERTVETNILTRVAISVVSGTGKSDPPPSPMAFNTRKMFEQGQSAREFRRERRKLHRDRKLAEARAKGRI